MRSESQESLTESIRDEIEFTTPEDERDEKVEKAETLHDFCLGREDKNCLAGFVDHLLEEGQEDVVYDILARLEEIREEAEDDEAEKTRDEIEYIVGRLSS
ncbi:MAG: hypothetical protein SV253_07795 [Halobacteria archaeon]|nr:hypothetical protein [Halobacteria archaeon]